MSRPSGSPSAPRANRSGPGPLLRLGRQLLVGDDLIDEAILLGLTWRHEVVALGIVLDPRDILAGVLGQEAVEGVPRAQDLLGVYVDVGRLALKSAQGLVDHDPRVRERPALALGARGHEERTHRG